MRETYGGKPKTMNSPRQVLFASLIGTAIEFFDFYIYATAGGAGLPKPLLRFFGDFRGIFTGLMWEAVRPQTPYRSPRQPFGLEHRRCRVEIHEDWIEAPPLPKYGNASRTKKTTSTNWRSPRVNATACSQTGCSGLAPALELFALRGSSCRNLAGRL